MDPMSAGRLVFAVFLVLQVADGLITYGAVSIFGGAAEGNPLLQTWIQLAGAGPALFGAKLLACGCGALLYVHGVERTLALLTALYLVAAVGPWLHLLSA
ncbi:MAG: hypothetical protein H0W08_16740 [Acidobacteria bacterium]|nr:hypothetical protein [Acidobacteriota bacterium]